MKRKLPVSLKFVLGVPVLVSMYGFFSVILLRKFSLAFIFLLTGIVPFLIIWFYLNAGQLKRKSENIFFTSYLFFSVVILPIFNVWMVELRIGKDITVNWGEIDVLFGFWFLYAILPLLLCISLKYLRDSSSRHVIIGNLLGMLIASGVIVLVQYYFSGPIRSDFHRSYYSIEYYNRYTKTWYPGGTKAYGGYGGNELVVVNFLEVLAVFYLTGALFYFLRKLLHDRLNRIRWRTKKLVIWMNRQYVKIKQNKVIGNAHFILKDKGLLVFLGSAVVFILNIVIFLSHMEKAIRISAIAVKTESEALLILDKLKSGEDFVNLAKNYGEGEKSGSWGYVATHHLSEKIKTKLLPLKTGKPSEVIKLDQYYYILMKTDEKFTLFRK